MLKTSCSDCEDDSTSGTQACSQTRCLLYTERALSIGNEVQPRGWHLKLEIRNCKALAD